MHASIDHLLSLRDGQPVDVATAAHVEQCQRCSAELRKLRETRAQLQSLPQLDAPSSFQEIQRAMARPVIVRRPVVSARLVAAAAFVTLTTIFFVALRDETTPAVVAERSTQPQEQPTSPIEQVETARVPELVAQSQQLEGLLQNLPERPRIERVSTAAMIDTIEDRIQLLDFQLSEAGSGLNEQQTRRLWRERVELMDSLVKVRYAEGGVTF
jgi:anti-sigma factor RsiW